MDELASMMQKSSLESGSSMSRLIDTQNPTMLGSQKRAKEYVVLSDPVSWSLNNQDNNLPGSTSTINISNKGVLDLKRSYIEFTVANYGTNHAKIISPISFWEVISWQIGSSLQVQLPYHQPLQEVMFYRKEREEISRDGIACDAAFKEPTNDSFGAEANLTFGQRYSKYQIPFSALCQQFEELEHLFVSLGQPLQIQLRLRQAANCLMSGAANANADVAPYSVGKGRLILSYVEMDQASMDRVIRSKIQCLMPHHQVIPVALAQVMNMSFSVNRKDFIRYLVITTQGTTRNTQYNVTDTLAVNSRIAGVIHPRLPIRRLTVILGQQQIVLLSSGITGASDHLGDDNLSDFPYLFQYYNAQQLFCPWILDLTRFGIREDAFGSQVETQTLLVQIELETSAVLPAPYTGTFSPYGTVQCFGYLCTANQISIENGMYKRD